VSRVNDDGARVAGARKAGRHHGAFGEFCVRWREEELMGAICADSGAPATNRHVTWLSVLCVTGRGTGQKVFMDRWLWAVGTVM
jgi:hypothetical protein